MISVFNYKKFERGFIIGFFDLNYYGLQIEGCRLMKDKKGGKPWVALPQNKIEIDGKATYIEFLHLPNEKKAEICDLAVKAKEKTGTMDKKPIFHISPEGEDLSEYYSKECEKIDLPF